MVDEERPCHVGEPDNRRERRADDSFRRGTGANLLFMPQGPAAARHEWLAVQMSSAGSGEAERAGHSIAQSKAERLWFFRWRRYAGQRALRLAHTPDAADALTVGAGSPPRSERTGPKRIFGRSQRQALADEAQRQRQGQAACRPCPGPQRRLEIAAPRTASAWLIRMPRKKRRSSPPTPPPEPQHLQLQRAVAQGDIDEVEKLLKNGARPDRGSL